MPAASARVSSKGKENAAPPRATKAAKSRLERDEGDEGNDTFDAMSVEEDLPAKPLKSSTTVRSTQIAKPARPIASRTADDEAVAPQGAGRTGSTDLERRLAAVTAERDRLRTQRDAFSKQFDELSDLRKTQTEAVFEKYKEKAAIRAKTQDDLIASLTTLNESLEAKVNGLEKALATAKSGLSLPQAGGVFDVTAGKADVKDVKALKEEVTQLRDEGKKKDERISSLEREYKAEIEHSRSLQAAAARASAPPPSQAVTSPEEGEKDYQSLRLYEDLTDLSILHVKVKPGKYGKEVTYNCVQTVDKRSVNFKLRATQVPDPALLAAKSDNPWVKSLHYIPEGLDRETDQTLLARLGIFKQEFTVPREQVGALWEQMKLRISRDGVFEGFEG